MDLNYLAHIYPNIENWFAFNAKDDQDAMSTVMAYILKSDNHEAKIFKWDTDKKKWDYSKALEVKTEEKPREQETEYRFDVTYTKYIKFSGVTTERAFDKAVTKRVAELETLPDQVGWICKKRTEKTRYTDDDRYHAKTIEEIKLDFQASDDTSKSQVPN